MKKLSLVFFVTAFMLAGCVMLLINSPPADNPAMNLTQINQMNDENFSTVDILAVFGSGNDLMINKFAWAKNDDAFLISGLNKSAEENEVKAVARNGESYSFSFFTSNMLVLNIAGEKINRITIQEVGLFVPENVLSLTDGLNV